MITWMQRHKKYLIITIWISTIAFVGAGFVGWGQYNYGDKAGAVAKVGNVEITMGELQKSYSRLYSQYNQMFQGQFDEEKAKTFGLQRQALEQLTNQALILNLAASYDLRVNDAELLADLKSQEYFFKDGVFSKAIYKEALSRNNLGMKEYENDLRKQLLIQKVLKLLPVQVSSSESDISNTIMSIADKIQYKVLNDQNISIDTSDALLKPYWEQKQQNFMTEVSYDLKYIKQEKISKEYTQAEITEQYTKNKTHFKGEDGKIMDLADAKESVIAELNEKTTKEMALRGYIAYKKRKTEASEIQSINISKSNNIFNDKVLEKITQLSITSPYLKPVAVNGEYFTFELTKVNPSKMKTFEEAKDSIIPLFTHDEKRKKLLEVANNSLENFEGIATDFITAKEALSLQEMTIDQANEFLSKLFNSHVKKGIISLKDGSIVLYEILEQKMLTVSNENKENPILKIKNTMFNEGMIKNLQNKYTTNIFMEGL